VGGINGQGKFGRPPWFASNIQLIEKLTVWAVLFQDFSDILLSSVCNFRSSSTVWLAFPGGSAFVTRK
jgi:hypothetical protein